MPTRFVLKHLPLLIASCLVLGCPEDKPVVVDAGRAPTPAAHLEKSSGKVTLERNGQAARAQLGYLFNGDALETGSDGEAVVRFGGGRRVEVGPDARFVITQDASGIVLEVARGLLLSRIPAAGETTGAEPLVALSIVTPFGITRVGSGENSVSVNVTKDDARVEVLIGSVELVSRGGKAANVGAGDAATLGLADITLKPKTVELTPMPIDVVSVSGRAEIKRKNSRRWEVVGKKGATVDAGDSVRGRDGRTLLRAHDNGKTQLGLTRGTELTLRESGKGENLEDTKLDLSKGTLDLDLAQGTKSKVSVGELELESDLGGRFTVVKTADGFELSSRAGDLKTKWKTQEKTVRAGERAVVSRSAGTVETSPLTKPGLALPSKSNLTVYQPPSELVLLTWDGPPTDYQVEVASDSEFKQPLVHGTVHANEVHVPAPPRGSLYWRVKDAAGTSEVAKGSASFKPETSFRDLDRQRNEVEDGSEKTTIYFQDKPPAVTFVCKPDPQAASFRLKVYKSGALGEVLVERTSKQERIQLEGGQLTEGSYVWELAQLNAKGEQLKGDKLNQLEITYDNSVPSVVVQTPKNGDVVRGNTIDVAGVAPVGSRVYANGKLLALDEKHRFRGQTSPVGRPPSIIFRTTRANGAEVYTVRTLRRAR